MEKLIELALNIIRLGEENTPKELYSLAVNVLTNELKYYQ